MKFFLWPPWKVVYQLFTTIDDQLHVIRHQLSSLTEEVHNMASALQDKLDALEAALADHATAVQKELADMQDALGRLASGTVSTADLDRIQTAVNNIQASTSALNADDAGAPVEPPVEPPVV